MAKFLLSCMCSNAWSMPAWYRCHFFDTCVSKSWINGQQHLQCDQQLKIQSLPFAIVFGNKDKEGWDHFWQFTLDLHPCLNREIMTTIMDQQKGSKAATKMSFLMRRFFTLLNIGPITSRKAHLVCSIKWYNLCLQQFSYVFLLILL